MESQIVTAFQSRVDSLDEETRIDVTIIESSKAFELVPYDRLLAKNAGSGVYSKVVVKIRDSLLCRSQRVRAGRQLSEGFRITSGAPQESVLVLLIFLVYVNGMWRNIYSTIKTFRRRLHNNM